MADNVDVTEGAGKTVRTDEVGTEQYQVVKLDAGGAGVSVPLLAGAGTAASALRTVTASDDPLLASNAQLPTALGSQAAALSLGSTASTEDVARTGIVTEAAPANDTASSGLNGRLQRIAQNITSFIKSIGTAAGATDNGIPPLALRDDSLAVLSDPEGDWVPLRTNNVGALHVTTSTSIVAVGGNSAHDAAITGNPVIAGGTANDYGSDQAAVSADEDACRISVTRQGNVRTIQEFTYNHISTATTTVVKSGAGLLHNISVNTKGTVASTITVYDNTAGSGTVIAIINSLDLSGAFVLDVVFLVGLTIVTTGTVAPDLTVSYK